MNTRVENKNGKLKMIAKKEQKKKLNKLYGKTINLILKSSFVSMSILGTTVPIISHAQTQNSNANQTSILAFSFNQIPSEPKISYINGTKKLIIDFENAGSFTEEPKIKDNPFIESINIQRSGNKLRIAIDTKETVQYSIIKNGFNYYLKLKKSSVYQEDSITLLPNKIISEPITPIIKESIVKKEIVQTTISTPTPEINNSPINVAQIPVIPLTNPSIKNTSNSVNKLETQVLVQPSILELEHLNIKAQGKVAKLTLDLSDRSSIPTVTQTGNLLIIDLPGVKIPDEFQKNVSTSNLGSVVQNMDVATQKGSGRIVLSQNENWEYSLYQMDKKVVIEVKPTNKETDKPVYKGKPFTLDFQNMDVRSILHVIADFSGLNIIASDSVNGSMTLRLNNVPWDQVLDLILESKGLQKQKDGNVVWVATRQEIADKNKSQLELNNQAAELAPLKLEFFQLNHYKAKEMKEIIEGKTSSSNSGGEAGASKSNSSTFALLSKRGSVGLDVRNNTIFIQDTETKLEEVKKIIKRLDVASKQVLIEAKLVVVDDKFQKDIGAKFGFALGKQNNSTGIGISNSSTDATAVASRNSTTGSAFNLPVTGGGSIGFTILNAITGNMLNIELSALEQNNRGKVISNPRLLTADNKKAEIRQGTEIPYVTPGSNNSPATVSFKDAVLSLGVTPQVSPNGRVSMDLDISKDTVGQLVNVQGGGQVPSIDTRKITTQVTVNDGQTVVLGGIYEVTSRDDLSKIPLLGDIPWIGNLFKNTSRSNEKVELLIFITPHVIYDEDLDNINKNEQTTVNEMDFKKK